MNNELIKRIQDSEDVLNLTILIRQPFDIQALETELELLSDCRHEIERLLLANETLKELNAEYCARVKALEENR